MTKTLALVILSAAAMTASLRADDNKAPAPAPQPASDTTKTAAAPATPASTALTNAAPKTADACCGDSCCSGPTTKVSVLMSPKMKSLAMK
jgi:hypothetical protein